MSFKPLNSEAPSLGLRTSYLIADNSRHFNVLKTNKSGRILP